MKGHYGNFEYNIHDDILCVNKTENNRFVRIATISNVNDTYDIKTIVQRAIYLYNQFDIITDTNNASDLNSLLF